MKKDFFARPEKMTEMWNAWQNNLTAIPSPVFVVTGWKSNGRENACLQSWSSFIGSAPAWGGSDDLFCIMPVNKNGHMYNSLNETGVCVLNFPAYKIYDRCIKTIGNNEFETDEITAAGLTAEKSVKVNAPRIKECFLNIECELLEEHEFSKGNVGTMVSLKAVNICIDPNYFDQDKLGRYGKTGYLFQIDNPTNPDTGERTPKISVGTIEVNAPVDWITK